MKKIAAFCIPAHGHTNPMLPVIQELIRRNNQVRFYSFEAFRDKIEKTGAVFVSCDRFLPKLDKAQEKRLKKVSSVEMTLQDLRMTCSMSDFLEQEIQNFQPDTVYTDSVCFWGKLIAQKYGIPMVVSTSTFAFNRLSSRYLKSGMAEKADLLFGLPKMNKALRQLEAYGYSAKNILSLIASDDTTDSIVYTSADFQPYGNTFSEHYAFVGPSLFSNVAPDKAKEKPLVYISMGTVLHDCPAFYRKCVEAFRDKDMDVIISCGKCAFPGAHEKVPQNIKIYPFVNQLDVLSKADVFITHCGMNSVSESLYMATPMVLYPQTGEQAAVAKRTREIGAGILLKHEREIYKAVWTVLTQKAYSQAASLYSSRFRSCGGPAAAAKFIETAPH